MSEHKHGHRTEHMPLPAPRSTQELDEKILAYARDNAPRQRRHRPARWVAGLATAGIVAVAVLIALPQRPTPQLARQVEERGSIAEYQVITPVTSMKMSGPEPREEISALEEYADEPAPAAARALPATPMADSDAASLNAASAASELAVAGTAAKAASNMDKEQLHEQLELCAELLETGREAQARASYQALREQCPACELPESLEEAVEQELPAKKP